MPIYNLKVNGQSLSVNTDGDTPLLWVLRDHFDLVGTKLGVVLDNVVPVPFM